MICDQEKGTFTLKIIIQAGFKFAEIRSIMPITLITSICEGCAYEKRNSTGS